MHNPNLITGRIAVGSIAARVIAQYGTENNTVTQADGTARPCGITTAVATNDGDTVDLIKGGLAYVTYGGDIKLGDAVMANENGHAVSATEGKSMIGYAEVSGVAGDIGSVWISPGKA